MCHSVAAAAPAVHCNGIQPYRGAAWYEGRLYILHYQNLGPSHWPILVNFSFSMLVSTPNKTYFAQNSLCCNFFGSSLRLTSLFSFAGAAVLAASPTPG